MLYSECQEVFVMVRKLKKVLILHTGGTFAMAIGEPSTMSLHEDDYLSQLLEAVPVLNQIANVHLKVLCNIDSSEMEPKQWKKMAHIIYESWEEFDGFVIIHGTDTMAWSATALSFFLRFVSKPVIFTGAQRPLMSFRSDARANIIDAVELATYAFPHIAVCLDSKVLQGSCITKFSSTQFDVFKSFNAPSIGDFGFEFRKNAFYSRPKVKKIPEFNDLLDENIFVLTSYPGAVFPSNFLDQLLSSYNGIVIRAFGGGGLPIKQTKVWLNFCRKALAKKIPVVMGSQCAQGRVDLSRYEHSREFKAIGVISSFDMTFEASCIKLMIMLGRKIPFSKRHQFFEKPLAGELVPPAL